MKNIRKLLLVLCFGWMVLCFCGCQKLEPMTIDTQMNITSAFDGERFMTMKMPKNVLDRLFEGSVDRLREVIEKYCPGDLGCTIEPKEDHLVITFCIPFASCSEYKTKVFTILTNSHNPNRTSADPSVYYDCADTLFKEGFTLTENFDTWDLLAWIPEAIHQEFPEYADEDLAGLFVLGETKLSVDGQSFPVASKIHYSNMESCAFDQAKILMNINQQEGFFECQVELVIARDKYEELQNLNIDAKIKSRTNSKMDLSTTLSNTDKTYFISFKTKTATVCKNYLDTIFDSKTSVISVSDQASQGGELKSEKAIEFYVNTGNYLDFSVEGTEAIYVIQIDGKYNLEKCTSENRYLKRYALHSEVENESKVEIHLKGDDHVTLLFGTDISVDQIDVTTKVSQQKKYERNITFYLSAENDALIGQNLQTRIEKRLNDQTVYKRVDIGDGSVLYSVDMTADSADRLSLLTCAFLDGSEESGTCRLTGGADEKPTLKKLYMRYNDTIDFSGFLGSSGVLQGIHYTFEYPKGYMAAFKDHGDYEKEHAEYSVISCVTQNKSVSVDSVGEIVNYIGIATLILWYISLALILVILLIYLPAIIRSLKLRQINWTEIGLFKRSGYVMATLLVIGVIVFAITSAQLIFKIY